MYQRTKTAAAANQSGAMETGDHFKNGAIPKAIRVGKIINK